MNIKMFFVLIILCGVSGCATTGGGISGGPRSPYKNTTPSGMYHQVKKGETLYSIARAYSIVLDKLIAVNRIPNPARIEQGQLIFIPGASASRSVTKRRYGSTRHSGYIWPVEGQTVSSFGQKSGRITNKGIDIKSREGADIRAAKDGVVSFCSDQLKGYGKTIIVDHRDGYQSVYAYNTENLVGTGQKISQGQVIGRVGKTGRTSEPMLHFEIRKGSVPQNPFHFLP